MEKNKKIKLIKELNVTDLSGEKVMVDFESGKYFLIKGVGNDIWDMIQTDITVEEIIEKLLADYDVTREVCEKSVVEFLERLAELEFIE